MTGNESKRNCKRIGPEWEWTRMPETIEYVDIEHEAWNAMPLDEGGFDEDLDDEYEEACRLAAEERDIAGAGVPTCAPVSCATPPPRTSAVRIEVVSMRRGSGYRKKVGDVYVGRPTAWGNPYEIGRDGTREEVIEKYRDHIARYPDRIRNLRKLLPTRLVCWCAPEACHADVLAEMLAEVAEEEGGA